MQTLKLPKLNVDDGSIQLLLKVQLLPKVKGECEGEGVNLLLKVQLLLEIVPKLEGEGEGEGGSRSSSC